MNKKNQIVKRIIFLLLFILTIQKMYPQFNCEPPTNLNISVDLDNVTLNWYSPDNGSFVILREEQRNELFKIFDTSPVKRQIQNSFSTKDFLDIQFSFPTYFSSGEAGIACDGDYIYSTTWNDTLFFKYNLDGSFAETIAIPGVGWIRNLVYCPADGLFYGTKLTGDHMILSMDFNTKTVVDTISLPPFSCRALGYNTDLDVFYTNDWSTDVLVVDRTSKLIINTLPLVGSYGNYYGFAYDNYSSGGPYLWGFSQDNNGAELVQLTLPGLMETGISIDIITNITGATGYAGGLFIQPDIVDSTVTLGGMVQNEVIFGLELENNIPPPPSLAGYNVYRDGNLLNTDLVIDTIYNDHSLDPGTYLYEITSVYHDTAGVFHCESDPVGPVTAIIEDQLLTLGGNVFVGTSKLDIGKAHSYNYDGNNIIHESSVDIGDFGYYFFFPFQSNDYYVVANPSANSAYYSDYIPTYYGDVYHWEDSPIIHLQNNLYNEDINLIEMLQQNIGVGNISGIVSLESKDLEIVPGSNVLILLFNSNNECISFNYTNIKGEFSFNQLGNGTYSLLCEIIGKKMNAEVYTLDDNNANYNGINFLVLGDEIVLGCNENIYENVNYISHIYPNPVSGYANVEISLFEREIVTFKVCDITGKVLESNVQSLNSGLNKVTINTTKFAQGIKFLVVEFKDNSKINRKFIVH